MRVPIRIPLGVAFWVLLRELVEAIFEAFVLWGQTGLGCRERRLIKLQSLYR